MKSPNFLRYALSTIKVYATSFCQKSVLVLILLVSSHTLLSQPLAFPSAEGAGAYITGGRGGIVVKVTNLNATGTGSLRSALLMTVPRTIVFDVSGRIHLTSLLQLGVANSNFTVAGQTAPQGGITISGRPIQMGNSSQPCNNAIWRYIRFRNGSYTGQSDVYNHNGFISNGTDGLILDHCSFSFCDDQAISMDSYYGALKNITIQRCTFSENSTQIILGLGGPYERGDMTFSNNLFVDVTHRTPNMGGNLQWDLINNVFFNWGNRLANANDDSPRINHIGNYYKLGTYSSPERANVVQSPSTPIIYTANNYHTIFYPTTQLDDRDMWTNFSVNGQALPSNRFTTTQHPLLGAAPNIKSADETYTDVTSDVGANRYLNANGTFGEYQDSFDTAKIANVLSNTSSNPSNKNWTQPTLPNNTRSNDYDTDNDGMPDAWEILNGLDLNDASDRNIVQVDGYTNLEYYLNGLTLQTVSQVTVSSNATNDTICEGSEVILTASSAVSYVWDFNGETTPSITVSPDVTTTYTVTGTHADASTTQDEITINVNQIPVANAGSDTETCLGTEVTLTASGGITYLWSTGETSASIDVNPNNTTTYTVEAFENSCSSIDEVIVTVNEVPDVDAGDDQTIFVGESALLTATGADSYLWNTGDTTASITVNPLIDTTYSVIGTTNNCETTDTVTVFLLDDSVNANAGADTEICIGESTTLTATGGTTYLWNTGETAASIEVSPTETTTYTVTAFSASGANFEDDNVIVTVNDLPIANAGNDVAICFGNVTTLTASGGASYLWNTGETTETITVNPTQTTIYTVEVFENNCSSIDQTQVIVNQLPETNAGDDVSIIEGNAVTLTASEANSYVWNTGETTASVTVSPNTTTTYTVMGTNANGCESMDDVVVVTMSDDVTANAGDDIAICNGESTTLTATGGTTYLWSTGETAATIEVSPTTTTAYTVIAYSMSGANTAEDSVTVTVNDIPVANAGDDISICLGNETTLTASGGSTYLWNTGETAQTITVNPTETTMYTVEVFENNCSSTDQIEVTINQLPETNAGNNVSIANGESTTLTASGADSYVWNTGETTSSITVSPNNTTTYTVIGTNSNGCEFSDNVIVSVGAESVTANAGNDITICNGQSTTLTATGGASYLWNTGETTASITVNPNQTTTYTVTAFNATETASDDDSVTVVINELPETNAGNDITIIEGDATTLTASGADSYVWNTGETTSNITVSPISTTTYTVTGTNANGCESSDAVIVSVETENINANAGANVAICNGESTTLTASGGTSYLWSTGQTTATIEVSPVATMTYIVTVFSANGSASDDDSVTVTVNEIPVADAGNDVTICFGNETTLTASGGETYLWSTGETTQNITINPNNTTTYSVEVFSDNCSSTDDVIVTVNDLPETNAGNDITIIEGDATTLTATGADSYVWSTGETTSSISVNPMATTTYTVTGATNGCESIDSIIVTVAPYTASAGANQTICQGYETTLTASEGDSYLWSTGETTQSITVNPTNTQTYTVTVFEGNYQADAEVEVGVNPNPNVVITNGNDVMILEGEFITLSASGANTYAWNNGATQPNIAVSPSITTTYEVTGFINNCEDTTAIVVNVLETVQADAGEDLIICNEEIVTLTANGGDEYLWNNGETTQSIDVSPDEDTEYSVLVYNALDSDEDTIMVFVEECSTVEFPVESETFDFVIYQDPTTDILNVKIDGLQSVTARGYSIYDLAGKIIYTETFNPSDMQELSQMTRQLDVSTYSRGVYIVRLIYDDTSIIKKIPIR